MRVVVFGAGAMGSIFGSALGRAGATVVFYDNRSEVIDAIRRDGVRLSGVLGDFTFHAPATAIPEELGAIDLALVVVDSSATADVARIAERHLVPDGFALTLQNGIGNWEALAERLGKARVMAGSTFNSGAGQGPGRAAHTNLGPTVMGEAAGGVSERARGLAALFASAGLPFELSDEIEGHVWSKFVHNCAINPVSAVTGLRGGEIARTPAAARLLDAVLDEVLAVVAAAGVRLPEDDPRGHIHDHCWERYNRPSMLQHLESGRGTEIDALNGALVKRGRALGVPVPVNETIVNIVKALEAAGGRRELDLDEARLEAAARAEPRAGRWG
ncbi:MAG: ketopantoate reductase family protein [Bauldia sp.]